jgi:hypothetical protein
MAMPRQPVRTRSVRRSARRAPSAGQRRRNAARRGQGRRRSRARKRRHRRGGRPARWGGSGERATWGWQCPLPRRRGGRRESTGRRQTARKLRRRRRRGGSRQAAGGRFDAPPGGWMRRARRAVAPLARVLLHRFVDEIVHAALELARHLLERLPQDVATLERAGALLVRIRAHRLSPLPFAAKEGPLDPLPDLLGAKLTLNELFAQCAARLITAATARCTIGQIRRQ